MSRNLGCMIDFKSILADPIEFEPVVINYFKQKLLRNANDNFKEFIVQKHEQRERNVFKLIDKWLSTKQRYYDLKKQLKQVSQQLHQTRIQRDSSLTRLFDYDSQVRQIKHT
jgi:hypothetical protein